eukprot:6357198-Pyramimonas_sp.AAC.2
MAYAAHLGVQPCCRSGVFTEKTRGVESRRIDGRHIRVCERAGASFGWSGGDLYTHAVQKRRQPEWRAKAARIATVARGAKRDAFDQS